MSLWKLVAADLLAGAVAFFALVVVAAADHPTTTQGVIAWSLFVILVFLAIALLAISFVGLRRLMRRKDGRVR